MTHPLLVDSAGMTRTAIHLPAELRDRLRSAAAERGIPVARLVRESLEMTIASRATEPHGGFLVEPG